MRNELPKGNGWLLVVALAVAPMAVLAGSARPGWAEDAPNPQATAPAPRTAAVKVRAGNHPGFGRLVFDVPAGTTYHLSRDLDHVHLYFSPSLSIGDPQFLPRNVASAAGGESEAELVVRAGVRVRSSRIGERVVVDVLDPAGSPQAGAVGAPAPAAKPPAVAGAAPATVIAPEHGAPEHGAAEHGALQRDTLERGLPERGLPERGVSAPHPPAAGQAEPAHPIPLAPVQGVLAGAPEPAATLSAPVPSAPLSAAPVSPAPVLSGPIALAAVRAMPVPAGKGAAFSVPFGADTGAAALRRGELALVVFDRRRPIDMAALRADPVLAGASVQLLPAATLIRLRLPPGMEVALRRGSPGAWTVAVVPVQAPMRPIRPVPVAEAVGPAGRARLLLAGDAPGEVVSLADPDSGATLLLGTQRQPGQGIAVTRHTPRYVLLSTWQGVAVQPLADNLSLRAVKDGFFLSGADVPMAQAADGEADGLEGAAGLTRRFDFPDVPVEALQRRMQAQVSDAALAPARARGKKRFAAAQTMIALGLAAEAQAVLQLAAEEDPAMAASADVAGLGGIAALLAGRMEDSRPIEDPRLSGTDEVALWRAIRMARRQENVPQAAAVLASTLPLILAYPAALRDRLLPVAIETMIDGGEAAATAAALARQKDNPALALARAMKLQADGDVDGALAAYEAAVRGPDQRQQALAESRAVELRLASHRMDGPAAADALDRQFYNWRGDLQELALRERVAALRAEAGGWRPALALLRETLAVFPDQKAEIRAAMHAIFASALRDKAADTLAPLDLITLLDENADLLAEIEDHPPPDAEGSASGLQARLAEKMLALDLPRRAGPQLERLMLAVPPGAGRAGFGASLAALKLREGDGGGALATLSASDAQADAELPASLLEQRALLLASASARGGDRAKALAALEPFSDAAAGELRSTILEQGGDWPAAARALTEQAARLVPEAGELSDEQRRLLVRLASAASQAGDEAMLERLRTRESPRMASGPLADMFRLLTADRVQSATDLKRAGREMAFARTVSAGIKALEPPASAPTAAR